MNGPVRVTASHARAKILETTGQVDANAFVIDFAGSRGRVSLNAEAEINLKTLAVLYGRYVGSHRGKAPPGPEEFRKFIKGMGKQQLEALKVTDPEKLFKSPRDNQPYVILYNVPAGVPGPQGAAVIGYEKEGSGGKRYVAFNNGGVEEVDEDRFKQLVPAHRPAGK